MDRMLTLLIVAVLIAVAVFGVRLVARKVRSMKAHGAQNTAHPRKMRWATYALTSLIGLALIVPVAIATGVTNPAPPQTMDQPKDQVLAMPTPQPTIRIASPPTADPGAERPTAMPNSKVDRVVVSCGFSGDAAYLAKAFKEKNYHLLDLMATGCHIPADGPLAICTFTKPQDPKVNPQTAPRECLARAPPATVQFGIVDELGDFQVEEWVQVSLDGEPIGVIHLYDGKSAEMLAIGTVKAGTYTYNLQVETHYDQNGHTFTKHRTARGSINVQDGKVFELVGCPYDDNLLWLQTVKPSA